jgi:hypothetical protein
MKFYRDEQLTDEIVDSFSFGIVPVGEAKNMTIWVKNDDSPNVTGFLQDIQVEVACFNPENDAPITDEKIDILEAPKDMPALSIAPIRLEWVPAVDLEQGLKARISIRAYKIIG